MHNKEKFPKFAVISSCLICILGMYGMYLAGTFDDFFGTFSNKVTPPKEITVVSGYYGRNYYIFKKRRYCWYRKHYVSMHNGNKKVYGHVDAMTKDYLESDRVKYQHRCGFMLMPVTTEECKVLQYLLVRHRIGEQLQNSEKD